MYAYLIVAYNNWNILNRQIRLLDYPGNDIYLLIDQKSSDWDLAYLPECRFASVYMAERREIWWAEYSQVKAMLDMLEMAFQNERKQQIRYSYFHFFSGVCLPIKTQLYIQRWCDSCGKELIGIVPEEFSYCVNRTRYYWFFLNTPYYKPYKILKGVVHCMALGQKIFGVNRLRNFQGKVYNGWDWASVTHDFAGYLLSNVELIREMFKKTLCPSELWIHTLAMNSDFKDRIYKLGNLCEGSMRYIDWKKGKPYTFGASRGTEDYALLINSPYLFARKFDEKVNFELVEKMFNTIIKKQLQEIEVNKNYRR